MTGDPKTMAFGGVAIGIIKAKLAASVAGNINRYGCTPATPIAIPLRIGTNVAVVAVLDVSSVKKITLAHMIKTQIQFQEYWVIVMLVQQ